MKSLKLLAAVALFSLGAKAQTINDVPIADIDVDYVEIVGSAKAFSNKLNISLDFGQHTKLFSSSKSTTILDENGKNLEFNSMVDALNFMAKHGYNMVQAYTVTQGNSNVYHYLLRKEK